MTATQRLRLWLGMRLMRLGLAGIAYLAASFLIFFALGVAIEMWRDLVGFP